MAPSLVWFVLDSVSELDLDAFYSAYRSEGWGAAAHDPQMMVALALRYSIGVRSGRGMSALTGSRESTPPSAP